MGWMNGLLAGAPSSPPLRSEQGLEAPPLTAPCPGTALSQPLFPAILHPCDNRTMGLPAALPRSRQSHSAFTRGRLDPRKEGRSSDAGNLPETFKGRCEEEGGLQRSSSWRSGSPDITTGPAHTPQLLAGCLFEVRLPRFKFQLCHLPRDA